MLQFRRNFEYEHGQLQDLNARLRLYLSRVKELEQDNALLITEINTIAQERTAEWEEKCFIELRELRKAVNQLTWEKSKAEMERERLGRELQAIQALCCEETVLCRDIEGECKGCERQLQQELKQNGALEKRLVQLECEYACLEDAHRQEVSHLRHDVNSKALPIIITQNYQGHPAVTMEEIERYAHMMSETLNENFEVYCRQIEDLENSIKADRVKLEDLDREKSQYIYELEKLHQEAHEQSKLQLQLDEELTQMQDRFQMEMEQYQGIIRELEEERRAMAHAVAEKLNEYQQLMQVKMGLSLEVATYRALLEEKGGDSIQKMDQYSKESSRRIDIKMPAQPWSTTTRQEAWKPYLPSTDPRTQYTDLASNLKASFGSTTIRSTSPARVVPISISPRDQKSTPARRDMPSFSKASQAATNIQKTTVEHRTVRTKEPLQKPVKDSANQLEPDDSTRVSPRPAPAKHKTILPTTSTKATVVVDAKVDSKHDLRASMVDKKAAKEGKDANKVIVKEWTTPHWEDVRISNVSMKLDSHNDVPEDLSSSDKPQDPTVIKKITVEETTETNKELRKMQSKDPANLQQPSFATRPSPGPTLMKDKTAIVTSSTESTTVLEAKMDSEHDPRVPKVGKPESREEKNAKVTVKYWTSPDWEDVGTSEVQNRSDVQSDAPEEVGSSKALPTTDKVRKIIVEERTVRAKESMEKMAKDSDNQRQQGFATEPSSTAVVNGKGENISVLRGHETERAENREDKDASQRVTVMEWTTSGWEDERRDVPERSGAHSNDPEDPGSGDEKTVDYTYIEEIIEKVMRPAGLDTKFMSPSPDSKVAYRMEKMEDEDGKTKTQIVLESRVEEDIDITDDSALADLLSKEVKKVSLEDIKGTPTGTAIENLLSLGHPGGAEDLKHKSVNVEIIEEPAEDHVDDEGEAKASSKFSQPSSMSFQIEELDSDSHGTTFLGGKAEMSKSPPAEDTEYQKAGSVWDREGCSEADDPYSSHAQETEYFVSTPDDSISESEEGCGISSSGHYGVVDDLSDERYYQDVPLTHPRVEEDKGFRLGQRSSYMRSEHGFVKDTFPECIIEEELQDSPTTQDSILKTMTEESMDPQESIRGALGKLKVNVSESVRYELSQVTKSDQEGPENQSIDVKKVLVSEPGTATIIREVRDLEDSDLLDDAITRSSDVLSSQQVQHDSGSKTVRDYTVKIIRNQDAGPQSMTQSTSLAGSGPESLHIEEPADDAHKMKRVIKLGPNEGSLTFQMDIENVGGAASQVAEGGAPEFQHFFSSGLAEGGPSGGGGHEGMYSYVQKTTVTYEQDEEPTYTYSHEGEARKWDDNSKQQVEYGRILQTQFVDPQVKVSQEKKIATVYLDSEED